MKRTVMRIAAYCAMVWMLSMAAVSAQEPDSFDHTNTPLEAPRPFGNAFGEPTPTPAPAAPRPEDAAPRTARDIMEHVQSVMDAARQSEGPSPRLQDLGKILDNRGPAPSSQPVPSAPPSRRQPGLSRAVVPPAVPLRGTLSVIVSAEPQQHLEAVLRKVERAVRSQSVALNEVLVVGSTNQFKISPRDLNSALQTMAKGLVQAGLKDKAQEVLGRAAREMRSEPYEIASSIKLSAEPVAGRSDPLRAYGATSSPVWVVHIGERDFVFEGDYDPSELFDNQGNFIGHNVD